MAACNLPESVEIRSTCTILLTWSSCRASASRIAGMQKTVIRGGWGTYFGSLGTRLQDALQYGFSQNTNVVSSLDGGQTFVANIANPFPNGFTQPPGAQPARQPTSVTRFNFLTRIQNQTACGNGRSISSANLEITG